MTEIEADPGTLVETETAPVENLPLPFWRRWIHYGLTISVSLLLLLLAWLGFRQLRRMAREKKRTVGYVGAVDKRKKVPYTRKLVSWRSWFV